MASRSRRSVSAGTASQLAAAIEALAERDAPAVELAAVRRTPIGDIEAAVRRYLDSNPELARSEAAADESADAPGAAATDLVAGLDVESAEPSSIQYAKKHPASSNAHRAQVLRWTSGHEAIRTKENGVVRQLRCCSSHSVRDLQCGCLGDSG